MREKGKGKREKYQSAIHAVGSLKRFYQLIVSIVYFV